MFEATDVAVVIERIDKLSENAQPQWGSMNVSQMLAHCNVTYEMIYDNKHKKPNAFTRFLLKAFVKPKVISDAPYKRNSPTAPQFKVADDKNFQIEKTRLVDYINKTLQLGADHFNGKESLSFGKLSSKEWNAMFYKHLDHHLNQFGIS